MQQFFTMSNIVDTGICDFFVKHYLRGLFDKFGKKQVKHIFLEKICFISQHSLHQGLYT